MVRGTDFGKHWVKKDIKNSNKFSIFCFRSLNDEMTRASKKNKAFRGIQSNSDFISLDADLWNVPLLGHK